MGAFRNICESERLPTSETLEGLGSSTWRPGNTSPGGKKPRPDVYHGRKVRAGYDPDKVYNGKR